MTTVPSTSPRKSAGARRRIAEAAFAIAAERGLAGVSYRRVATKADVSLALVNYHFPEKEGLIAAAIAPAFGNVVLIGEGRAGSDSALTTVGEVLAEALFRASAEEKGLLQVRFETLLETARNGTYAAATRSWVDSQIDLLAQALRNLGLEGSDLQARSLLDLVIGFQLFVLALRLDGRQATRLLDPEGCVDLLVESGVAAAVGREAPSNERSAATRACILDAAIAVLVEQGMGGVGFRPIAERAGVSGTAPAYHFKTVDSLLASAELLLTAQSKDRYRAVMRDVDREALSLASLVEVTAAVFIREATEFSAINVAFFANWIEASRRPELSEAVRRFVRDIHQGWCRLFGVLAPAQAIDSIALMAFASFLGKLIRTLATGSSLTGLTAAHREFEHEFEALCAGQVLDQGSRA